MVEYSYETNAVYCFVCRFFGRKSTPWVSHDGIYRWDKGWQHAESAEHCDCLIAWADYKYNKEHNTNVGATDGCETGRNFSTSQSCSPPLRRSRTEFPWSQKMTQSTAAHFKLQLSSC